MWSDARLSAHQREVFSAIGPHRASLMGDV
jgi:hypothetical protein